MFDYLEALVLYKIKKDDIGKNLDLILYYKLSVNKK